LSYSFHSESFFIKCPFFYYKLVSFDYSFKE
jgi:hypothetical protein